MKRFDYYCRHLQVLKKADQEDLSNEFIVSGMETFWKRLYRRG